MSYVTSEFNRITKRLLDFGFNLDLTLCAEHRLFVKDKMGWRYSGVSEEEHNTGLPKEFSRE